jgi:hypothetical protein
MKTRLARLVHVGISQCGENCWSTPMHLEGLIYEGHGSLMECLTGNTPKRFLFPRM